MPRARLPEGLIDRIRALPGARVIVALAGAPASGKSALADAIIKGLRQADDSAEILPMDGYHLDDAVLIPAGLRPVKGAPQTFDVDGFYHTLSRLRRADEAAVAVPVFDREQELSRAAARLIPAGTRVILTEGNYLLMDAAPWDRLAPLYDLTLRLDVPEDVLRDRLIKRWQRYGIDPAEITRRVEENDLPNGRRVTQGSRQPDVVLTAD